MERLNNLRHWLAGPILRFKESRLRSVEPTWPRSKTNQHFPLYGIKMGIWEAIAMARPGTARPSKVLVISRLSRRIRYQRSTTTRSGHSGAPQRNREGGRARTGQSMSRYGKACTITTISTLPTICSQARIP